MNQSPTLNLARLIARNRTHVIPGKDVSVLSGQIVTKDNMQSNNQCNNLGNWCLSRRGHSLFVSALYLRRWLIRLRSLCQWQSVTSTELVSLVRYLVFQSELLSVICYLSSLVFPVRLCLVCTDWSIFLTHRRLWVYSLCAHLFTVTGSSFFSCTDADRALAFRTSVEINQTFTCK